MNFRDIFRDVEFEIYGNLNAEIKSISYDSRDLEPGAIFFAIRGEKKDGHQFIGEAIEKGADAVVVERLIDNLSVPQILVEDTRRALSKVSSNLYNNPSKKLKIVGVTGTNGKTTTVYILNKIFEIADIPRGTIGTLGYTINSESFPTNLTTPDSLSLQKILHKMVKSSVELVAMEVSSHALVLKRVEDVSFFGGIFTNISHDHLDFHLTMENYINAKSELFERVTNEGFLLCNADDANHEKFIKRANAPVFTYSMKGKSDFYWDSIEKFTDGIKGTIQSINGKIAVVSPISGEFNLYNILAASAASIQLGIEPEIISEALLKVESIPGRLQEISRPGYPRIFIDFAHTPDAVKSVLSTLRKILSENGKLITVFGCGGNRDTKKRSVMAKEVELISDSAIVTDDNPRFEDSKEIIGDILEGFSGKIPIKVIENREEAIKYAIRSSRQSDIVAILGKGHENYQEIKGIRYPYSDAKVVEETLYGKKA